MGFRVSVFTKKYSGRKISDAAEFCHHLYEQEIQSQKISERRIS